MGSHRRCDRPPCSEWPERNTATIGLRDLLAFEQQTQREEQDKEAERLAKAAAKAAHPPRVISGYKPPGDDADIGFGAVKVIEKIAKFRAPPADTIFGRKVRWPDTGRKPRTGWPEE